MSANSRPIQVIPAGFLGMIDLKNTGQLPDELVGNVQPVVDMTAFWLRANFVPLPVQVDMLVTDDFVFPYAQTVPENQWWYVHNLTATLAGGVLAATQGLSIYTNSGSLPWVISPNVPTYAGSTATALYAQVQLRDFWLPPGADFGVQGRGSAAGPSNVLLSGHVTKCRV